MFLVFGQFYNATADSWQWQQVGGTPWDEQEADQYAYGFARDYGIICKVVGRHGTKMYLPPETPEERLIWPDIHPEMIQTQ